MSRRDRATPIYKRPRPHSQKAVRDSFLIFCEGEAEVGYFSSFKKRAKRVSGGNAHGSEKGQEQGRQLHMKTFPIIETAIGNARRGHMSFHPDLLDAHKQTSTLVYSLVETILKHS